MTGLSIKALNLKEWENLARSTSRAFNAADTIRNVSIMLEARFKRVTREQFNRQGAFGESGRWKALSPKYAERKSRLYPGKTILRRRDIMFKSFTKSPISLGSRSGNGFFYRFGSDVEYSRYHQEGTDKMPQRKIIDLTKQQLTGISAAIGRTIVDGLFTRGWFDAKRRSGRNIGFINTGFDIEELP